MGLILIDNPKEKIVYKNSDFFKFIATTPKDSVFAVYFGEYKLDIPNVGNRAVFIGNGFPFNESYFLEYQDRMKLLYGSRKDRDIMEGKWEGEKIANFYRKLKPNDFLEISKKYRLDYVVIEAEYSESFKNIRPVFENSKVKVYQVSSLKGGI